MLSILSPHKKLGVSPENIVCRKALNIRNQFQFILIIYSGGDIMWEIIAAALLCIFATLGFVAFIKGLIFRIYKPQNEKAYIILDIKDNTIDLEYTLRSYMEKAMWSAKNAPENIIIMNNNLSHEQMKICRMLSVENEIFRICTPLELYRIFSEKNT